MQAKTVTVSIPVRDLDRAVTWYQSAFELGEPELVPMDGLAEFDLDGSTIGFVTELI